MRTTRRNVSFLRQSGHIVSRLVNEELKELLEEYAEREFVEFIPITVKSKEYGDRQYYIVHFKKIYDVIDEENTVFNDFTGSVIKLRVDYAKVKNLHVFNRSPLSTT